MFPSPIYGASFKLFKDCPLDIIWNMFPSPIYGASFKLSNSCSDTMNNLFQFPSPIYGASFKLSKILNLLLNGVERFRPLYTGLVSNNLCR